jgi:hypothetical protein
MGKDDKDVLVRLFPVGGVDERFLDLGIVHVEVTSEDPPEDAFKDGHPGAFDRTGDESAI